MNDQQTARYFDLLAALNLLDGDYDEHGANRRNTFNRDPADAGLWAELETLESLLRANRSTLHK